MSQTPQTKYLKDYQPPAYLVDHLELTFELSDTSTLVHATQHLTRNPEHPDPEAPLVLDGVGLELLNIQMDGVTMGESEYERTDETLTLPLPPKQFKLHTLTRLEPHKNTTMMGLYQSNGTFCTQCEAEGFRKITFFQDRPDVMTTFTCTLVADPAKYPDLLSNGNLRQVEELPDGRKKAIWDDPFKKPSYLFALVAGDLHSVSKSFKTMSGKSVDLIVYTDDPDLEKCEHALESLKNAMIWDEKVYGREYDLNCYMIVAVSDFNMGAMENKGLNIFNAKYVLARTETGTDTDFQNIEGVVAHEYFHNWTGNRVTLKNWFQLSLKEGITVFRDQEFSADMSMRATKRISDVRGLRAFQFPEDAGPMAHAVRPESYIEMNNFYTTTVYEKGAEVVRMIHHILGPEKYRAAMDDYFERFDGKAITTEDFIEVMEAHSDIPLDQFRLWYSQAGTPRVQVSQSYDEAKNTYSLHFKQHIPDTPNQTNKKPMHIPISVGLLDTTGEELDLYLDAGQKEAQKTMVLNLKEAEQTFTFHHIDSAPVPSILRGFSAPVIIEDDLTPEDHAHLLGHDSDAFNRWNASQQIILGWFKEAIECYQNEESLFMDPLLTEALNNTILDDTLDPSLVVQIFALPSEMELAEVFTPVDVDALHEARKYLKEVIAETFEDFWVDLYKRFKMLKADDRSPEAIGQRALRNTALSYLSALDKDTWHELTWTHFDTARNMTDQLAALSALANGNSPRRDEALERFYEQWKDDALVMDKWFAIQASISKPETLDQVKQLIQHPNFSMTNPNKVRSLIGVFCRQNPWCFHQKDGRGYVFLKNTILELNQLNPQVASRMASIFNSWKRYDEKRQGLMKQCLEEILKASNLSKDVYEIVSKALA